MVDIIKEPFYVKIDYTIRFPSILPYLLQCLMSTLFVSVTIGVGTEYLLEPRFEIFFYHHLRHTVGNGRNTQFTDFSVFLGYLYFFNRWWKITS